MNELLEQVESDIHARNLMRRGERILVAVSGGLDSMVLLHTLVQLSKSWRLKLSVAHFNHQLRGRSSDADERLVKMTATTLGLPFHAGRGDVKCYARKFGVSIEMAARDLRHEFLAGVARKTGCRVVATAHHADDQVELFFLRLLRGAGGEGLAGMKWRATSPKDSRVSIIRPLLALEKSSLAEFAAQTGIVFREDASNRSTDILRNRVRLELLPLLRRRFQGSVDTTVARLMEIIGAEAELVTSLATEWLEKNTRRVAFKDCPVAMQRRIIQLQLQKLGHAAEFDLVESLRGESGKKVSIATDVCLVADDAGCVSRLALRATSFNKGSKRVRLDGKSGDFLFSNAMFSWEMGGGGKFKSKRGTPGIEMFDAEAVGGRIVLRHWKAGDRFQPIGMKSAVKLQDLFVNQKIPAALRRELILATTERGEVFWVEGLRIGERFKIQETTIRSLVWRWRRQ